MSAFERALKWHVLVYRMTDQPILAYFTSVRSIAINMSVYMRVFVTRSRISKTQRCNKSCDL